MKEQRIQPLLNPNIDQKKFWQKRKKGKDKGRREKKKAWEGRRGEERKREKEKTISKQITTVNTHFSDFSDSCLGSEIFFSLTLPLIHFGMLQNLSFLSVPLSLLCTKRGIEC